MQGERSQRTHRLLEEISCEFQQVGVRPGCSCGPRVFPPNPLRPRHHTSRRRELPLPRPLVLLARIPLPAQAPISHSAWTDEHSRLEVGTCLTTPEGHWAKLLLGRKGARSRRLLSGGQETYLLLKGRRSQLTYEGGRLRPVPAGPRAPAAKGVAEASLRLISAVAPRSLVAHFTGG